MHTTDTYDIVAVGGGLAGLSLAILAARAGYRVAVVEKETYPFHRVCGEYISMESYGFLQRLGLPLGEWNLPIINTLLLTDTSGRPYQFKLPLGGFGLSRYRLDAALYQLAQQAGATVLTGTRATDVVYNNGVFEVLTPGGAIYGKLAAGTFGKRSNLDIKWKRAFAQQKNDGPGQYVAVKYHVRLPHSADTIALHNFKNGYCGLSRVEEGISCLCYLTTAANLAASNNSIAQMEQNILCANPALNSVFKEAVFLYERPLAIAQVNFSRRTQVEKGVLMMGDSAGLITPLCGNGMSMALHAGKIGFDVANDLLLNKITRQGMEQLYTRRWQQNFARRLWVGRRVQHVFGGKATTLFLRCMHQWPGLAQRLIAATHGQPF